MTAGVSCALTGCFIPRLSFASGHSETWHAARKCIRKHHCSQNQTPPGSHQSTTHIPRPPGDVCGDIQAFPRPGAGHGRELRCSIPAPSSGDGDETLLPAPEAADLRQGGDAGRRAMVGRRGAALAPLPPRSRPAAAGTRRPALLCPRRAPVAAPV